MKRIALNIQCKIQQFEQYARQQVLEKLIEQHVFQAVYAKLKLIV